MKTGDLVRLSGYAHENDIMGMRSSPIGIVVQVEENFYMRSCKNFEDRVHVLWSSGDVTFGPAMCVSMLQQENE